MDTRESMLEKLVAKTEEDTDFRSQLITDPKSALKKAFDVEVPDDFNVVVHEDDHRTAHLVLPAFGRIIRCAAPASCGRANLYGY